MVHWSLVKLAIDVILFLLVAELKWTAIKDADTSVLLQIKNNTLLFWVNTIAARICRLVSNRWKKQHYMAALFHDKKCLKLHENNYFWAVKNTAGYQLGPVIPSTIEEATKIDGDFVKKKLPAPGFEPTTFQFSFFSLWEIWTSGLFCFSANN